MKIEDVKIGQTITATPAQEYEEWTVIAIEYSTGMVQGELVDTDCECGCVEHVAYQWFRAQDVELA